MKWQNLITDLVHGNTLQTLYTTLQI